MPLMWKDLKALLNGAWETDQVNAHPESDLRLAAAALLVEVMRADFETDPDERAVIRRLLIQHFERSESEADELLQSAEREVNQSVSLHPAVSLINEQMSRAEKVHMVELLWKVAYADGQVDKYEDAAIRKIAELIYVEHSDFIRMKHKAAEAVKA